MALYNSCKIDVETGQQAVLIRREGLELEPDMELAPPPKDGKSYYKGVQAGGPNNGVLTEGRYFYNPYYWSWEISPQFVVPGDKIGIRIALSGDDMPPVQILAEPGQKGILREVLKPGRYPYNPYAESIELHDPVTIPAGFRGVVTRLAGPMPKDPNVFLVEEGERGVQTKTLDPGTYYLNPYEIRVSQVDCRSRRFNLGQEGEMSFLSADGFPITLDGVVEFRILPEKVAEMFVKYNESANGDAIDEEIIAKIITPESRSLCRIGGSKLSGGQFISGEDREKFQTDLVKSLTQNCQKQGIEILAVAITSIQPPSDITEPVQQREVAKQKLAQFKREKLQQLSEAKLKVQVVLAEQKKRVVEAEQEVVEKTTKAEEEQKVAETLAEQKLKVAQTQLEATKDKASAILAKAEADADVIKFDNAAEAAGLAAQVSAFDGDGAAMARNMLLGKLAPSFRTILGNSEGPLMDLFSQFTQRPEKPRSLSPAGCSRSHRHQPDVPTQTGHGARDESAEPIVVQAHSIAGRHFGGGQAMNHPFRAQSLGTVATAFLAVVVLYVVGYLGIWQWMVCRIEVPPGSSLLVRYKGPWPFGSSPLAPEGTLVQTAVAGRPLQVGILEAMPGPGRHFYSPLEYETQLVKDQVIPPGKLGVLVSKIGKPLPEGTYLVDDKGFRGILRKVLTPGRYRINTYAFDVKVVDVDACAEPSTRVKRKADDPTLIPPGYVGVVTNKASDPAHRARTRHPEGGPATRNLLPQSRGEADRHRQHRLFRDQPECGSQRQAALPSRASSPPRTPRRRSTWATAWARRRPTIRSTRRARASSFPPATAFRFTSTTRRSGAYFPSRRRTSFASSARSRMSSTR